MRSAHAVVDRQLVASVDRAESTDSEGLGRRIEANLSIRRRLVIEQIERGDERERLTFPGVRTREQHRLRPQEVAEGERGIVQLRRGIVQRRR